MGWKRGFSAILNEVYEREAPLDDESAANPDGTGATQMVTVSGLTDDASIEAVVLEIDIDHPFPNDLGIHLVSPHGTRTVVNQVFNETLVIDGSSLNWRILSNAFFGETPNGNWQIDVFDGAADDSGSLEAWRLQFYYGTHPVEDDEGDDDVGSEPARHVAIVAAEGVEVLRQELSAQ